MVEQLKLLGCRYGQYNIFKPNPFLVGVATTRSIGVSSFLLPLKVGGSCFVHVCDVCNSLQPFCVCNHLVEVLSLLVFLPSCVYPFGKVRHNSRNESWLGCMYQKPHFWKIISVACGFSSIKIDYSDSNQNLVRCSIFNIQHSNFECRISNIKLNPTFKSNVEYRISN